MAVRKGKSRTRQTNKTGNPAPILTVLVGIFAWIFVAILIPADPDPISGGPPLPPGSAGTSASLPPSTNDPSTRPQAPAVILGDRVRQVWSGRCVAVADGDTITVLTADNEQVKIRLAGIDAPESHQPFGNVAKQACSDMCFGKTVTVYQTDVDRYRRVIAYIFADGINVNLEMVRRGLAWHYRQYSNSPELQHAEETARVYRIGLWVDPNPTYPPDFRKRR